MSGDLEWMRQNAALRSDRDDREALLSAARARIADLEARVAALIAREILPADGADEITVDGVRWVRVPAERRVKFY